MKFELETLEEYSDENLLAEIQRVVKELAGKRFTHELFDKLAKVHSSTVRNRFGSWNRALDLAGVDEKIAPRHRIISKEEILSAIRDYIISNPDSSVTIETIAEKLSVHKTTISGKFGKWKDLLALAGAKPVRYGRRYSDKECYENLFNLWIHYGRQPNYAELNRPPSTVGSKAYVLRWGGWRKALAAFINTVNKQGNDFDESEDTSLNNYSTEQKIDNKENSRSISLSLRYKILMRDRCRCVICGASPATDIGVTLHIDHIHPWSKNGLSVEENLRTLCSKCNLGKGDKIQEIN